MFDLTRFTATDASAFADAFRALAADSVTMEDAAECMVRCLYEESRPGCALVRFFKTHAYGQLPEELQKFADSLLPAEPDPAMQCLTLLATAGDRPEWNARQASAGHQAIPLPSAQLVERMPMIWQLIKQFGLTPNAVLKPAAGLLMDAAGHTSNVLYIPNALGSPFIPAQKEFVEPMGIRSVLGFGGLLPSGSLTAVLLFSKVPLPRETAERFRDLAQELKSAVTPFDGAAVFRAE